VRNVVLTLACLLAFTLPGCNPETAANARPEVTIAAAANLTQVFQVLGARFESTTGIHPVFSFGSTAQLAQQIENGAPFDVFAAADAIHVEELDRKGLLVSGSRAPYARGILALWVPTGTRAEIERIEDLAQPNVRFVAIAKPELAPYGQATVETLEHLGIWKQVQPKVVYAENISVARQYGESRNAEAVFTAYSLVLHEEGKVIRVDPSLHQPIRQELGIVAASKRQDAGRKFADFLLRGDGRPVLRESGYDLPSQ
jgi:molybdate transport system substrate-binding protein